MPRVADHIDICAERSRLWSLLITPCSIEQWFEGMDSIKASPAYPMDGSTLHWAYRVAGVEMRGRMIVTAIAAGDFIYYESDGLVVGSQRYDISDIPGGLQVDVVSEYSIKGGVFGKVAEPLVHTMIRINLRKSMMNLKSMAEAS
jgi:hypothetical protein